MGESTKARFPGVMIELPPSANQGQLLYVGVANARGEYPVLGWQKESMWVQYPSFDVYLAVVFELEGYDAPADVPEIRKAITEQCRLNLGSKTSVSAT